MSESTTSPRPYTSYNLFFQLEREYILQSLLGHQPKLAPEEAFDPVAETYPAAGPPLPSRYADLILPYDWHIPGKTRRRKRIHRKSHGKIGFHELNERIARAWGDADDEVRDFCVRLADIQAARYKKDEREKKLGKCTTDGRDGGGGSPLFEWAIRFSDLDREDSAATDPSCDDASTKVVRKVSCESIDEPLCSTASDESIRAKPVAISGNSANNAGPFEEVDMADDEIIAIWKKTPIKVDDDAPPQFCVEIACDAAKKVDAARRSFIEAEYVKFQKIGQRFSRRNPNGTPAGFRRNSVAACQA